MSKKRVVGIVGNGSQCGRTAYPRLTRQHHCPRKCSLEFLEESRMCEDEHGAYVPSAVNSGRNAVWAKMLPARFRDKLSPPYSTLCHSYQGPGNKQLFMAGKGGGATMHYHAGAFNTLFFGTKDWFVLPPSEAEISGKAVKDYISDARSRGKNLRYINDLNLPQAL